MTPTQRRLLAFVEPDVGLALQFNLPQEPVADLTYMLKPAGVVVTMDPTPTPTRAGPLPRPRP